MKVEFLQKFLTLDNLAFEAVTRHLGFASAACYRAGENGWLQILSTDSKSDMSWPPAVAFRSDHYSAASATDVTVGWAKPSVQERRYWPKNANFYIPEQQLQRIELLFAVVNPHGKRCRSGELNAALEVLAARIRLLLEEAKQRLDLNESSLKEHIRSLGIDLRMLIDHELRTPMVSVAGYTALVRESEHQNEPERLREFWNVIDKQTSYALEAIDKLSAALDPPRAHGDEEPELFDADEELQLLCKLAKERAVDLVGADSAQRVSVRYLRSTDRACVLRANRRMFRWSVWEVLKNAVIHSKSGRIEMEAFASDRMLVIDIEDDGQGVSFGSEELIFLRFYQDPGSASVRKGKRGLGLGLFLARQLVERHLGQLSVVRSRGHGSIFRFLWPLAAGETAAAETQSSDESRPERDGEDEAAGLRKGA